MIIYQDTKAVFLDDIANNYFAARIEDAFIKRTGTLPADSRGWANDYGRFASILDKSAVADDITIAIEYHCSPVGRTRIDVLTESKLFLADDNAALRAYIERLVPRKAKSDILFLLEHGNPGSAFQAN